MKKKLSALFRCLQHGFVSYFIFSTAPIFVHVFITGLSQAKSYEIIKLSYKGRTLTVKRDSYE
jgi:hypothetical protein